MKFLFCVGCFTDSKEGKDINMTPTSAMKKDIETEGVLSHVHKTKGFTLVNQ